MILKPWVLSLIFLIEDRTRIKLYQQIDKRNWMSYQFDEAKGNERSQDSSIEGMLQSIIAIARIPFLASTFSPSTDMAWLKA